MADGIVSSPASLRVPREDRQSLLIPQGSAWLELVNANRRLLSRAVLPPWMAELRLQARQEIAEQTAGYLTEYISPEGSAPAANAPGTNAPGTNALGPSVPLPMALEVPWIVGGHQPEWFHAGVWFKNFLLDTMARSAQGCGLHVVVDQDAARATSIRVPGLHDGRLAVEWVSLPVSPIGEGLPWNGLRIDGNALERTRGAIVNPLRSLGIAEPIADEFLTALQQTPPELDAASAFSRFRHRLELRHGLRNGEVSASRVASTDAWQRWVAYCMDNAYDLHTSYNLARDAYRQRYKVRNPVQPVPALGARNGWIELPFWIASSACPVRQRCWIQKGVGRWNIASEPSSSGDPLGRIAFSIASNSLARAKGDSGAWSGPDGLVVLPRALMTTLFLRLMVADLFVHGIGGGLYDRMTDAWIQQWLGIQPPHFGVCTATVMLPMRSPQGVSHPAWSEEHDRLWNEGQVLRSRPELRLDLTDRESLRLKQQHAMLLRNIPPRGSKRDWHHEMRTVKEQIAIKVSSDRVRWESRWRAHLAAGQERRLAQSREYSMALFPEAMLIEALHGLAKDKSW